MSFLVQLGAVEGVAFCLFLIRAAYLLCHHILSQEPKLMQQLLQSTVIIMIEEEKKLKYVLALKVSIQK